MNVTLLLKGNLMSKFITLNNFKSIERQESSDVFFLVRHEIDGNVYRVMPKGFVVHAEPNKMVQFLFGNELELLN